jgi:hypothetical protein
MKQMSDSNVVNMFQWKLARGGQEQGQKRLFRIQNQVNHLHTGTAVDVKVNRSDSLELK